MRFWKRTEGSVSVYGIIVILPIFLFQAVLVDLIRVRVAERETEMAVKAGLRSALSRYDPGLKEYGLFGLYWNPETIPYGFRETVRHNLSGSAESPFRYIDTGLPEEDGGGLLAPVYTLANQTVLERQIAEEMKVKAPVEIAAGVWNAFKRTGAKNLFHSSSDLYQRSARLEELYEEREKALDRASDAYRNLASIGEAAAAEGAGELAALQELAGRIGLRSIQDVRQAITDTESRLEEASRHLDELRNSLKSSKQSLEEWTGSVKEASGSIRDLQNDVSGLESEIRRVEQDIGELGSKRDEWKSVLADMLEYTARYAISKAMIEEKEKLVERAYTELRTLLDEAERLDRQWEEETAGLRQSRDPGSPVSDSWYSTLQSYGGTYFTAYQTGSAKIPAAFQGLRVRWKEAEWWGTDRWDELLQESEALQAQIQAFNGERNAEEAKREQRNDGSRKQKAASLNQIGTAVRGIQSAIGGCGKSSTGEDPYKPLYERLQGTEGLARKYRDYNRSIAEGTPVGTELPQDGRKAATAGFDLLESISGLIGEMKDDMLLHEFILGKLSNRTTGLEQTVTGAGRGISDAQANAMLHPLTNQEAEYTLYGRSSCSGNQGAAYGEMFTFFMAIRTVEAMMEPKTQGLQVGTPLLALLAAAAQGAAAAVSDVSRLVEGEAIPLLNKWKAISVTYADLLRLFMLLHGNDSGMLSRLQALLELNTGKELTQVTTYLKGTVRTSVSLWFIPGVMKLVHTAGYGCQVERRRCEIEKTVVHAYD